ncbi:MAG: 3-hydroxyacyl-CoA dehydrogenase, partial [Hyphomicrobiales bacterium]
MAAINSVIDLANDGNIAVITVNSPPVNALSQNVREGLNEGLQKAYADSSVQAIMVICDGRTFIAGADIREFGRPRKPPGLKDFQGLLDNAPKPVVAAIHGTALGGGLEFAMMCHYRIAVPSARCGLPEVNIGILPGGCGTQALPRIVGVERALEMMTTGRHVPAAEAHKLGIFDELAPEGDLRNAALAYAKKIVAEKKPVRRVRDRMD